MSLPWMPLNVPDYRNDTAHLGAAEHGAYLLLIMHYWSTGSLPDDDRQLARIASMTLAEWRRARPVVQAFFYDGWKHKRVDKELAKAADISSKRRASAQQKHSKSSASAPANAEQLDTHARTCAGASPSPEPLPSKKDSDPIGSAADAPVDHRKALFSDGLATLAKITGKTPNSCRSLVGKWLSSVQDEAIHIRGWIEEAERNAMSDPVGWIEKQIRIFRGDRGSVFTAAPRPGSKEDNRERTAIALRKLGEFATRSDDEGASGGPRAPDVGLLPFAKPARP